jgi:hypothetical protein
MIAVVMLTGVAIRWRVVVHTSFAEMYALSHSCYATTNSQHCNSSTVFLRTERGILHHSQERQNPQTLCLSVCESREDDAPRRVRSVSHEIRHPQSTGQCFAECIFRFASDGNCARDARGRRRGRGRLGLCTRSCGQENKPVHHTITICLIDCLMTRLCSVFIVCMQPGCPVERVQEVQRDIGLAVRGE